MKDHQIGDYAIWVPKKELVTILDIETDIEGYIAYVRNVRDKSEYYSHLSQLKCTQYTNSKLFKLLWNVIPTK